ncbi:MAG: hypothetical protein LBG17_02980 [Bacteroidales bacterium]|jgi:hypothetical protein|nr:hypothetical protein [Bacteroidales bacterium]
MKRIIFVFSFCIFSTIAFSQDYIPATNRSEVSTDKDTENRERQLFSRKFMSLNNSEVAEYFLINDRDGSFYRDFVEARRLHKIGKILWITGVPITGVGLLATMSYIMYELSLSNITFYHNHNYDYNYNYNYNYNYPFYLCLSAVTIGGCLIGAGVPLHIIGKNKIKKIKRDYIRNYMNEQAYIPNPSVDFGLTGNGVGFVLNF